MSDSEVEINEDGANYEKIRANMVRQEGTLRSDFEDRSPGFLRASRQRPYMLTFQRRLIPTARDNIADLA